jgi:hypothetical protein
MKSTARGQTMENIMSDERTLTERVASVEKTLASLGLADFPQDEGDMLGVVGRRDYGDAQAEINRRWSSRINDEKTEPCTSFEEIINRIQSATDRIHQRAGELENIGNRVMGMLPEQDAGKGGCEAREPNGTLEHAFMALNGLDNAIARLEAAALRLERV